MEVIKRCLALASIGLAASWQMPAAAFVHYQVSVDDPGGLYASFYEGIQSNLLSAGSEWGRNFNTVADLTLEVQFSFGNVPRSTGRSFTSAFVGSSGGLNLFQEGAGYEIATGFDPNGVAPDIEIVIGTGGYLQNELWFDPSPDLQTALIPADKTDARSVFVHELGHALGFNGWRDSRTGVLPGNYLSTFDAQVSLDSSAGFPLLYFTGSNAVALYGGPVPLTYGNYGHLGNTAPLAGADLIPDTMNGIVYYRGTRYSVTSLDLAILSDVGVPVMSPIPEPSTFALMLVMSTATLAGLRRRKSKTLKQWTALNQRHAAIGSHS